MPLSEEPDEAFSANALLRRYIGIYRNMYNMMAYVRVYPEFATNVCVRLNLFAGKSFKILLLPPLYESIILRVRSDA